MTLTDSPAKSIGLTLSSPRSKNESECSSGSRRGLGGLGGSPPSRHLEKFLVFLVMNILMYTLHKTTRGL